MTDRNPWRSFAWVGMTIDYPDVYCEHHPDDPGNEQRCELIEAEIDPLDTSTVDLVYQCPRCHIVYPFTLTSRYRYPNLSGDTEP